MAQYIDLPWPTATEILDLEKPRFSVFRQNGGQNYFRFRFSVQIRVPHVDLVDLAQNFKNF